MITMVSVEAKNGFGNLLDKAQRQMVSITRLAQKKSAMEAYK